MQTLALCAAFRLESILDSESGATFFDASLNRSIMPSRKDAGR